MNENTSSSDSLELVRSNEGPGAIELQERAQIDVQISTAHRFPRTLSRVKQDMLSFATLDEETAQSCFYTLPRGGKVIQGPSIRMAEIAISCYGNMRSGARVISTNASGENPHVVVQAVAHDLEKNTMVTIEKRGRIFAKRGKKIDEDDVNLACNRCTAIALRDAVFKVVPLALIKPVYEQAKLVAIGDVTSLVVKRTKIVDRLKAMGATEERILARVEAAKIDDVGLEKLEILIGLGTALKDNEVSLEEAFPIAVKTAKVPAKEDDVPFSFGEQAAKKPVVESVASPVGAPTAEQKQSSPVPTATEPKPADKPADQKPAQTELPTGDVSESAVETLTRRMAVSGLPFELVEEWAKGRKLDANKEADARKILNAWVSVFPTLQAKGGKGT